MTKAGINKGFLRLFILCGLVLCLPTTLHCQMRVESKLALTRLLPGEPLELQLTLINTGKTPLILSGRVSREAIKVEAKLFDEKGVAVACPDKGPQILVIQHKGTPHTWSLAPSDKSVIKEPLKTIHYCPLESLLPGKYELYVLVYLRDVNDGSRGPKLLEKKYPLEIIEPKGVDAAYLKDFLSAIKNPDHEIVKKAWRKMPIEWGNIIRPGLGYYELLRSLAVKYPTSTYNGYFLAHRGPSVGQWSLSCLDNPQVELHRWYDRGGGEKLTQSRIKKAQDKMRWYIKTAGPFLKSHPDFLYSPIIRKLYAKSLALTGDVPGAMDQIYILAKGQGKEAEEAQQYLIERESEKDKK